VRLPRAAADAPASVPAAPLASTPLHTKRVLVIDDNADAASLLSSLLQHIGHETRVALDGVEALRIVEGFAPDLVLCDIGLPGMDGFELVQRLRLIAACAAIPIVAISGYAGIADRERAMRAGFSDHFAKPFEAARLTELLASLVRASEA
jgi:CheY-like chemotaxis protein